MNEKMTLDLDLSPHLARLIYDVASYQKRCAPEGTKADGLKVDANDIREAANLVFLSLDLIKEWSSRS